MDRTLCKIQKVPEYFVLYAKGLPSLTTGPSVRPESDWKVHDLRAQQCLTDVVNKLTDTTLWTVAVIAVALCREEEHNRQWGVLEATAP